MRDTIYRDEAIKAVNKEIYHSQTDRKTVVAVLSALPSAEAEEHRIYKDGYNTGKAHASAEAVQGWIPCSERLPSESGTYLTTTAKGSVCTDHYYANSTDLGDRHWSYRSRREPIAWMPRPEPYKGGDDECL